MSHTLLYLSFLHLVCEGLLELSFFVVREFREVELGLLLAERGVHVGRR